MAEDTSPSKLLKTGKGGIYDFCAYRGCVNGRYTTNSRLYRFPKESDPRHAVWVENTGNKRLKILSDSSLRKCGLCDKHFEPNCFIGDIRLLARNAVPNVFVETATVPTSRSKDVVARKVNHWSAISDEWTTTSNTASSEPSDSVQVNLPWRDTFVEEQTSTVSAAATTIETGASADMGSPADTPSSENTAASMSTAAFVGNSATASTAAAAIAAITASFPAFPVSAGLAGFPLTGNTREYKKVAIVFSKSDNRCTLMKLESLDQSTVSSIEKFEKLEPPDESEQPQQPEQLEEPEEPEEPEQLEESEEPEEPEQPEESVIPVTPEAFVKMEEPEKATVPLLQRTISSYEREIDLLREANKTLKCETMAYRQTIRHLRRKEKRLTEKNEQLKIKAKGESVDVFLDRHKCTEPGARALVKMQLHRKNTPYTDEERALAKQLYSFSASAYTCLEYAGCSLPAARSVRHWLSEIDGSD